MTTVLQGCQVPRVRSVPEYVKTHGEGAAKLAAKAGLHLDPWQASALSDAMSLRPDGTWVARDVALIVPRQNGKGSVLEAMELYALFVLRKPLIVHTAHEMKTAKKHYERIKSLIESNPQLSEKVRQYRNSNAEISVELLNGCKLEFVARSGGSGRGFTTDLVVLDEAMILSDESLGALLPTLSAVPNAQLWYTGSAGMETSAVLARLRERGLKGGEPRLVYLEWSAPDDADPDDRGAWEQSNPSLGVDRPGGTGVNVEAIEGERSNLADVQFLRERLGVWASVGGSAVISAEAWEQCADEDAQLGEPAVLAVDVAPDRSWSSIAGASLLPDGRVFADFIAGKAGTGWAIARLADICRTRQVAGVVIDMRSAAASLVPALQKEKVPVIEVNTAEYGAACGRIFDAVEERTIVHRGQPVMAEAMEGARKRRMGDSWAWNRATPATDVTPVIAVTLALGSVGATAETSALPAFLANRFYAA